ncbi:RsfA family transcriptional regulator [Kroppenstedtia pulmonis]|uniref:RsfA family transcriptional regulator n=1 Tax=Kroppenstedtia pulmonis TaxID=1380685 RepID=A0A7D4B2W2_9BACL|nr:RsfA family transcriptional regulator [Kroppenstedtia pulmonis]QKG84786.1 RsfA family transcriptional regulator [Kroppenstedtia pulmonis]
MSVKRQDAWTPDDDLILAEVTLRHIREGGTQLNAFEEVAEKLGRTPAACGFRWNSLVRKKYEAAIQIAKSQRQKRSQERNARSRSRREEELNLAQDRTSSLDAIIRFLRQHKSEVAEMKKRQLELEKEIAEQESQIEVLSSENQEMKNRLSHVQTDYRVVNDDYKALIQIMDRARKLAILEEEEEESSTGKAKFRMETNGNLERIE